MFGVPVLADTTGMASIIQRTLGGGGGEGGEREGGPTELISAVHWRCSVLHVWNTTENERKQNTHCDC